MELLTSNRSGLVAIIVYLILNFTFNEELVSFIGAVFILLIFLAMERWLYKKHPLLLDDGGLSQLDSPFVVEVLSWKPPDAREHVKGPEVHVEMSFFGSCLPPRGNSPLKAIFYCKVAVSQFSGLNERERTSLFDELPFKEFCPFDGWTLVKGPVVIFDSFPRTSDELYLAHHHEMKQWQWWFKRVEVDSQANMETWSKIELERFLSRLLHETIQPSMDQLLFQWWERMKDNDVLGQDENVVGLMRETLDDTSDLRETGPFVSDDERQDERHLAARGMVSQALDDGLNSVDDESFQNEPIDEDENDSSVSLVDEVQDYIREALQLIREVESQQS